MKILIISLIIFGLSPSISFSLEKERVHEKIRSSLVYLVAKANNSNGEPVTPSEGTGVIISKDGKILTTYHFLDNMGKVDPKSVKITASIGVKFGTKIPADPYFPRPERDLLLLDMPSNITDYSPACVANENERELELQQTIYSSGFPEGDRYFSGNGGVQSLDGKRSTTLISIPINDGQSGSPVYNSAGRIVGIAKGKHKVLEGVYVMVPIVDAIPIIRDHMEICSSPRIDVDSEFPACRDPSHGVDSWGQLLKIQDDSDWKPGGSSPQEFCGAKKSEHEKKYPNRLVVLVNTDERSRSNIFRHFEYRYRCFFEVRWEPTFKMDRGLICER